MRRLDPEQLVRLGNAAYGAGLCALMLGEPDEARDWFERASSRWRESWEHATPTSWGRPIGVLKAALLAGDEEVVGHAEWALGLGCATAESPIGRYAAVLALLVEGRDEEAAPLAHSLRGRDDFPDAVAAALAGIATRATGEYPASVDAVLASFEDRRDYLEDVPVADTVLVLQVLAGRRGLAAELRASALLPPSS
jgi:hypothetical protein